MTVRMACDCLVRWDAAKAEPICEVHQERRIRRLLNPPPPRIRAVGCEASGPYVSKES